MWLALVGTFLPDLVTASCRAAVCFSGHARSFMHPHVRGYMKKRLIERLECQIVDVFFYLTLEESRGTDQRRAWDNFTQQPTITAEEVRAATLEFNPVTVVLQEQHDIEELLVAFFNFVYSPTDLGGDTCMVSISRRTIHYAINRLWNGHQGYARCVPKCQADDVKILVNGSIRQPLRFQCKQDLHGQKPARAPTTRSESKR